MSQATLTLKEIASLVNGTLKGNETHAIQGVSDIAVAGPSEATFLANKRYKSHLETTQAGLILIDSKTKAPDHLNLLIVDKPDQAFQVLIEEFHRHTHTLKSAFSSGIHPAATIAEEAYIGENVTIGPNVTIDNGAHIGNGVRIDAGCSIGLGVQIGEESHLYPNVTIREYCTIGKRVALHPGTVIGDCGFGYFQNEKGEHQKVKQLGRVIIDDDVEIGCNSCVDRARFTDTKVGQGTKIDNQVYVGHGVRIGKHCLIVGQTGIAGSTSIGDYVMIGGQVAIDGHLEICSKTMIAATSAVSKSITKPGIYGGLPAVEWREFKRQMANFKKVDELLALTQDLEKRFEEFSKSS